MTDLEKFMQGQPLKPRIWPEGGMWRIFFMSHHGWHVYEAGSRGDAVEFLRLAYEAGNVRVAN